jgi:hypothetical protein
MLDIHLSNPAETAAEENSGAPDIDRGEDPSLESLLNLAHKHIEVKKEAAQARPDSILDSVLGNENLPPPPNAAANPFAGPTPADLSILQGTQKKKKRGFLSRLFGGDE